MATAPLLTATPSGDTLELRPGGSWTAVNGATLERLSDDVAPHLDRAGIVKVDMAEVRELDTLGAWLLEQLRRPDRGSPSGQPKDAGTGAGTQSNRGKAR